MIKFIKQLYLNNAFFVGAGGLVLAFALSFLFPPLLPYSKGLFLVYLAVLIADLLLLFYSGSIRAQRQTPNRLSNGDDNSIHILLTSNYRFRVRAEIFDELPFQFQERNTSFNITLSPSEERSLTYIVHPVKRGVYAFGSTNVYVRTPLSFFRKRYTFSGERDVSVYPSFIQMRALEFMAISDRLQMPGIKKIRRLGHNMEFEVVKDYVSGDDVRTINWKATARRGHLMVNHYQDERSQQVYCLINKGRVMQMPFGGMSLLDYAINASLALSNIALHKYDKAGLITFQDTVSSYLPASRKKNQLNLLLEFLFNQKTAYRESDYTAVYSFVTERISQRSLLLLFTNFESIHTMRRTLPLFARLNRHHLMVVILFENTELSLVAEKPAGSLKGIYYKIIAEKFMHEKRMMVKELRQRGIQAVLTKPEDLSVNTINKYLELKARGLI